MVEFGVALSRPGDPVFGGSGGRALLDIFFVGEDPATVPLIPGPLVDTRGWATRARLVPGGLSKPGGARRFCADAGVDIVATSGLPIRATTVFDLSIRGSSLLGSSVESKSELSFGGFCGFCCLGCFAMGTTEERAEGVVNCCVASRSLEADGAGLHIERMCLETKCLARSFLVTNERMGTHSLQNVEPESNTALASATAAVKTAFTSKGVGECSSS